MESPSGSGSARSLPAVKARSPAPVMMATLIWIAAHLTQQIGQMFAIGLGH
jgi:hypothetical protein